MLYGLVVTVRDRLLPYYTQVQKYTYMQALSRTAASGKTSSGGLCIFENNNWCTKSKEGFARLR